ncbi:MAG TPA: hypothetical protein VLQ80_29725 [Candidatus Saccharimonadia bacterium]|nr:hypothetical protein [Candidatus Saccharimonadia bacterium]
MSPTPLCAGETAHVPKLLYVLLVEGSTWAPEIVRALWQACLASDKPAIARFVERTARASNVFGLRDQHVCDKVTKGYLQQDLTGKFLVEALEALQEAGTIDRAIATQLQERVLMSMDR